MRSLQRMKTRNPTDELATGAEASAASEGMFHSPSAPERIHLLKSLFSCVLEMLPSACRSTANSHLHLLPALSFLATGEMQREGKLLLLLLKATEMRGLCQLPAMVPEHRFQQHPPLAVPPGKMCVWLSALLEKSVGVCLVEQPGGASNTQQV